MTEYGGKISDITIEQVREQLADEADPKAIKRLTAAREYLDGQSPGEIDAKFGWDEQTIYGWLNRFEERGFEAALYDDKPSGRPPRLDDEHFQQFAETLNEPPEEAGYDVPVWSSALAQHHLLEEFDVAYSQRQVRRWMHKAGVSVKRPRPQPASADEEEREEFEETVEKK